MSIPRFVNEYASYKKKSVTAKSMREDLKEEMISKIDRSVDMLRRGYITIDEAMSLISGRLL